MAELKLSAVWKIKDFAEKNDRNKKTAAECRFESDRLLQLRSKSFPGLQWKAQLCIARAGPDKEFAGFHLKAGFFGSDDWDPESVWASYTATVLDADGSEVAAGDCGLQEYAFSGEGEFDGWGMKNFFKIEDVNKADRNDGSLHIRVDLTILKIRELLKFRELLRGLLSNGTLADFEVSVEGQTFKLHKNVLFASGMEVASGDGALDLSGSTTPAAFEAFAQAIYCDKWNFLGDIDLTQDVLHLAEKFHIGNLKNYCDVSLAEKVNEANALEILTKSAALCNAKKATAACVEVLAQHSEFEKSPVWLHFKKRNRGVAFEILYAICKHVNDTQKREIQDLKRKCKEGD